MHPSEPAQPASPPPPRGTIPPAPTAPPPVTTRVTGSPSGTETLDVRVSKRLLWVNSAVYPLRNIARVFTYTIHPRRKEAVVRFVRRAGITAAVASVLALMVKLISSLGEHGYGDSLLTLLWVVVSCVMVYALLDLVRVLAAPSYFVLGVETSGPSTAVIAGRDPAQLQQLVLQISGAIEDPETEFQVRVETLVIDSPSNYYFGDNVNMYGGNGNVGMANS